MSQETCCSFCEQLPEIAWATHGGSPSKCPLCKQALWVSANGVTSRMLSEAERALVAKPGRWNWLTGIAAALVVCLSLGAAYRQFSAPNVAISEFTFAAALPSPPELPSVIAGASAEDGPPVQVKPALPAHLARVKPSWQPPEEPRTIVPTPAAPVVLQPHAAKPDLAKDDNGREEVRKLVSQLNQVPQVDLDASYRKKTTAQLAQMAQKIAEETKKDRDAFVHKVKKEQPELAGLPFLMGNDCSLSDARAKALATGSVAVRTALAEATRYEKYDGIHADSYSRQAEAPSARFWKALSSNPSKRLTDAMPALRQILFAENRYLRLSLTRRAHESYDPGATELLANRAVFDLDPEIREIAVEALRGRPKLNYSAFLTKSLRYPWEPAARHAAEAVTALQLNELIPVLVAMLNQPDPDRPFTAVESGKSKTMVRELVRINHHRNCMLCHAPISATSSADARALRDLPIGPVPSAQESLPPSNTVRYYAIRPGVTGVRADVTYLRQDFSGMQKVDTPGRWPEMQRFDFLIRSRELSETELKQWPPAPERSEFKEAILVALRGLTGKDGPPQSQAWRRAAKEAQVPAAVQEAGR